MTWEMSQPNGKIVCLCSEEKQSLMALGKKCSEIEYISPALYL